MPAGVRFPHGAQADPLINAESLHSLSDDGRRYELLSGRLVSEPPVGGTHGRLVTLLAEVLGGFVRKNRMGVVYTGDTGFVLAKDPDTVRAPDLAFLSDR